ncbi:MAG: transposase [Desulfobacterales bacterium]
MNLITHILEKMSTISTPQRKFLTTLFATIQLMRGRMTFRNLSRYSDLHERTYARQFAEFFDFAECSQRSLTSVLPTSTTKIAAMDCTFIEKSGAHTYGLDMFYHGSHSRAERGLEFSELAVVDVDYGTAYHLSMQQTPDTDTLHATLGPEKTRIDWYLSHLEEDGPFLPPEVSHLAVDGYYAKVKFVDGACAFGLHVVSKLRHDAQLRYLYSGPHPKRRGARKKYDGTINLQDLSRFRSIPVSKTITLYTAVVNSVSLKRNIRLVVVCKRQGTKVLTALLFSTDTTLPAEEVYRYYTARFQIEFLFRDAKQFTGLTDFQTCSEDRIAFHVNASLTALNFLKLEDRQQDRDGDHHVISIASWKVRKFNEHQLARIISTLGFDLSLIKLSPHYEELINYGTIAA